MERRIGVRRSQVIPSITNEGAGKRPICARIRKAPEGQFAGPCGSHLVSETAGRVASVVGRSRPGTLADDARLKVRGFSAEAARGSRSPVGSRVESACPTRARWPGGLPRLRV